MKKQYIKFIFAALIVLALGSMSIAQDVENIQFPKLNKLNIPDVQKITLKNGMRLYLLKDKSLPVINVSVRVNCGEYLSPAEKIGLASITGTVMRTGGTSKWTGDDLDEALESVGGSVETSIGLTSGNATVNILSEYTDLGLEILAEVLRRPVFEEDKIELAKVGIRSGISRRNDNPQSITFREWSKLIYGSESVYARHTEYATIDAIEKDDLIAFHKTYFQPQNIQMAVWGDFNKKDLLKKIRKYFGDWKKGDQPVPPLPKVDYKFEEGVYYVNKTDVNQTNIVIGHIGGLLTDDDYADRIVMNNIFGGSFASRLFSSIRSREGLAYAVSGSYTSHISYPGIFYAFASTKSETTVKTVKEIIKELKRMQTDAPSDDEMRMGKDGYLNSFVFNFDSKSEVVNRLMNYDFYGLPDDFLSNEKENVEKVTAEDVIAAANRNLRPDALKILVVGKGEDFEMPIDQAGLGTVTNIDITIPTAEEEIDLVITEETLNQGKELLDKAVAASGGLDNYKKVNAVSTKGTMTISTPGGDFEVQIANVEQYPGNSWTKINFMGREIFDVTTEGSGWETDQRTGQVVDKSEESLLKSEKSRNHDQIKIFREADSPSYQAVYSGSGTENGVEVDYLTIADTDGGTVCTFGINKASHVLVSKSFWGETSMGEGKVTVYFDEFKEVAGLTLPIVMTKNLNGQKVSMSSLSEFEINPTISEDIFNKPE